jgi:hypothetical protein
MKEQNHSVNTCITAPGLTIKGGGSALVKYASSFKFKLNSQIYSATAADAPSLALATRNVPNATVTGDLAWNDGTLVTTTKNQRYFTLVATLTPTIVSTISTTWAVTFSWLAGEDFGTDRLPNWGDIPHANANNQIDIGWVLVKNGTTAVFTPGTTALDKSGMTVTYTDNYAQIGQ